MYCLTTTALKNNMRLITVVMGEPDSTTRSSETVAMLDYGFNTYQLDTILSTKTILNKAKVSLGVDEKVNIIPKEDITILNSKIGEKRVAEYKTIINDVKAPVKKGDKVGTILVYENGNVIMEVDATVDKDVDKANIFIVYLRDLKDIISGLV